MKIGFVVDGRSEFAALPLIFDQVRDATGQSLLNPLLVDLQPYGPVGQATRVCGKAFRQLEGRSVDRIVVLIDREERVQCTGKIADELRAALAPLTSCHVEVVVKDRKLENWLVADPAALLCQPKRFAVSTSDQARVHSDQADAAPADLILRRATGNRYDKVQDAKRIFERMVLANAAANSRSFRRLMRVLCVAPYVDQSRLP